MGLILFIRAFITIRTKNRHMKFRFSKVQKYSNDARACSILLINSNYKQCQKHDRLII